MQGKALVEDNIKLCECGCGVSINPKSHYSKGHNRRGLPSAKVKGKWKYRTPSQLCECGCGKMTKVGNRFVYKHGCGREFGYKHTKETIDKLSKPRSEVGRMNIKIAFNTPEMKLKRSLIGKEVQSRPELRKQQSKSHKKLMSNPDFKRKHKEACNTPEAKKNFSKSSLKLWKDPEYIKIQMKARNVKQNKTEKRLDNILNNLYPGEYKFVGDGQIVINGKVPDFINVNGQKKIIELFGDYWHRNDTPEDRAKIFEPFGYQTLVIWEHELKNLRRVSFRINRFHREGEKENGGTKSTP